MNLSGTISLLLIFTTVIFSYKGLTSDLIYERYNFNVAKILISKEYKRLIASGFLHVSWMHLILNMLTLYFFSSTVEFYLGGFNFLLIYFVSLVSGNLFALFIHRNHDEFSSVGASGAVCGVIFASIALAPGMGIGFFILPVSITAWLYGLVFVLYSIYGIRSKSDNVGHEAHLAGALTGMLLAVAMYPASLKQNYITILLIAIPSIAFIYIILTRPHVLLIDNNYFKLHKRYYSIDQKYNAEKMEREKEVDRILEKISRKGMKSLTQKEKEILKNHSKTVR